MKSTYVPPTKSFLLLRRHPYFPSSFALARLVQYYYQPLLVPPIQYTSWCQFAETRQKRKENFAQTDWDKVRDKMSEFIPITCSCSIRESRQNLAFLYHLLERINKVTQQDFISLKLLRLVNEYTALSRPEAIVPCVDWYRGLPRVRTSSHELARART